MLPHLRMQLHRKISLQEPLLQSAPRSSDSGDSNAHLDPAQGRPQGWPANQCQSQGVGGGASSMAQRHFTAGNTTAVGSPGPFRSLNPHALTELVSQGVSQGHSQADMSTGLYLERIAQVQQAHAAQVQQVQQDQAAQVQVPGAPFVSPMGPFGGVHPQVAPQSTGPAWWSPA